MTTTTFRYPPSPAVLQWLAAGQLANRLQRAVRLWALLQFLYGPERQWALVLPTPFRYPHLRDRLFAPTHPHQDTMTVTQLMTHCRHSDCVCQRPLGDWVFQADLSSSKAAWRQGVMGLTGFSAAELASQLKQCPFATVHRSIRDDLKQLAQLGWLKQTDAGRYQCVEADQWPQPELASPVTINFPALSPEKSWALMRVLESVSFIQPDLEQVAQFLWEQLVNTPSPTRKSGGEPAQRIFIHLDYVLSDEMQERVDTYQEQIEQLWRSESGGVAQFAYWVREGHSVTVTVYPVCLHYVRRAKYLSAYGFDPEGQFGWHNYRLDRIASERLTLLSWGDSTVPDRLKEQHRTSQLPTPEAVQTALYKAWGFNFYFPRALLIMRFPPDFARWYVDHTERHPTFQPVAYDALPALIRAEATDPQEQQTLLTLIQSRSPQDSYYQAWIRVGDINVVMRLRDWRPKGEVIAPLAIRRRMAAAARRECENYEVIC